MNPFQRVEKSVCRGYLRSVKLLPIEYSRKTSGIDSAVTTPSQACAPAHLEKPKNYSEVIVVFLFFILIN
jgi:hypothetical protein